MCDLQNKNYIEKFSILLDMAQQCSQEDGREIIRKHLELKHNYWNQAGTPLSVFDVC